MPAYNKPGVYVQENLTPNIPVYTDSAISTAVFIGEAERGPTSSTSATLLGVPTLVTSWADFCTKFNFGSGDTVFSDTYSPTANARDLSYALYTFFNNNGSQAYVLRTPLKDSTTASSVFYTLSTTSASVSGSATATVTSTSITMKLVNGISGITSTSKGLVTLGGINATLNKSWPIFSVTDSTSFVLSGTSLTATTITTATGVVATASVVSTSSGASYTVSAKNAGAWGSKMWVKTSVGNGGTGYFDLAVYYNAAGATGDNLNAANDYRVDFWPNVSLNPSDRNYGPTYVVSDWVNFATTVTSSGVTPWYTYFLNTDGSVTAGPVALGTTTNQINSNWSTGVDGTNSGSVAVIATTASQLDTLTGPLTINYAGKTDTTSIDGLTLYSATRGDSFVVIDCTTPTPTVAIGTAGSYSSTNGSYGAMYYPQIKINDPATKGTSLKSVYPGGAVTAVYLTTDTSRGVYKAPAGTGAGLKSSLVVDVATVLSSADFDAVSNASSALNIIRLIPGAGFCVMGARTLKQGTTDDRYVPVRRTLNYLRRSLTNITQFSVFEPNGPLLWSQVDSVVENFLYNFWKQGGLAGNTASQAYYVKCDATTNTSAAQAAGELRIEVGVALQKPAEFVVIKLSQIQGGTTVTTSV